MQAEYEAVKSVVMPQVNEFLAQYGEEAVLAGFGSTATDDDCRKELRACFRELKKGDAYFISFVSDRYGDVPSSDVTEGFLEKVGVEADENLSGKSVMEIETLYAALSNIEKTVIYFREPFTKKEVAGAHKIFMPVFGEGRKVKKLKTAINRISGLTVHEYKLETEGGMPSKVSAEAFANRIAEDIKLVIAADMNRPKQEDKPEAPAVEIEETEAAPAQEAPKRIVAETPLWDALKNGEKDKYDPEQLLRESIEMIRSAAQIEGSDPDESGDLYDEAMDALRRIRKDDEAGRTAFDDTIDEKKQEVVVDEALRNMGLVYFAYARIEFNAKNFEGAAAWGKQSIESLTEYQQKHNSLNVVNDLSNVWMLMGAALANCGEQVDAIDAVAAAMACCDGLSHNKAFKPNEDFANRYRSMAQLAHTICINEPTGEAAKKWLQFCQQQSFQLSKMGDNQGMINYVNFSIALCEYQMYQQSNFDNMERYLNMIHEIAQMFLNQRNGEMLKVLTDKGRKLLEAQPDNERVIDIVCSIISLNANYHFGALEHEEALAGYTEVIERRDSYKNSTDKNKRIVIAADYARRASAYTELGRLDEAAAGYEEAISILKTIRDGSRDERVVCEMASAYMNYSVCAGKQGRLQDASKMINKASKLLKGRTFANQNHVNLRRRIRRMRQLSESDTPDAMYRPEFMEKAKAEMDKLRVANEYIQKQDFAKAADMIEEALTNLKEMNAIDIILPSEAYAANLTACGSIHQDKLKNEVKGTGLLRNAWAVLIEMERDGVRLNGQLVENLKRRLKIK